MQHKSTINKFIVLFNINYKIKLKYDIIISKSKRKVGEKFEQKDIDNLTNN